MLMCTGHLIHGNDLAREFMSHGRTAAPPNVASPKLQPSARKIFAANQDVSLYGEVTVMKFTGD